jgi:hypothetical protein
VAASCRPKVAGEFNCFLASMLFMIAAKVIYLRDASVNQALDEGSAEKIRCAASTISGLYARVYETAERFASNTFRKLK